MSGSGVEEKKAEEIMLGEPSWPVDWASGPSPTNLKQLQWLFEKEQDKLARLSELKGKDVILLIGLTGAGKSTLTNYLLGCELEEPLNSDGEPILSAAGDPILLPKEGQTLRAKMGVTVESETLVPNIFPLTGELCLVDCPGLEENRGAEYGVCAAISTQLVIQLARSVRVALVVSQGSLKEKASDFQRLMKVLSKVFKNMGEVAPSLLFLLNKAPKGYQLKPHLQTKLKQLKDKDEKELKSEAERERLVASRSPEAKGDEAGVRVKELSSNLRFLDLMQSQLDQGQIEVLQLTLSAKRAALMKRLSEAKTISREQFRLEQHCDFRGFNHLLSLLAQDGYAIFEEQQAKQQEQKSTLEELAALERSLPEYRAQLERAKVVHRKALLEVDSKAKALQLNEAKRVLNNKEAEIKRNQEKKDRLNEEIKDCGREDLVEYWKREADIDSDKWLMFVFGTVGVIFAVLAAPEVAGAMAIAGAVGGGAAVGSVTGWVISKIKKWAEAETFNYQGIPFSAPARLDTWTNGHGWLEVEESKPQEGRYKATFYGNPFYRSRASVAISVPVRNIPANVRRLQKIPGELKRLAAEESKSCEEKSSLLQSYDDIRKQLEQLKADLQSLPASAEAGAAEPGEREVIVKELEQKIKQLEKRIVQIRDQQLPKMESQLRLIAEDIAKKKAMMQFIHTASVLVSEGSRAQINRFCAAYGRTFGLLGLEEAKELGHGSAARRSQELEPGSVFDPVRSSALQPALAVRSAPAAAAAGAVMRVDAPSAAPLAKASSIGGRKPSKK